MAVSTLYGRYFIVPFHPVDMGEWAQDIFENTRKYKYIAERKISCSCDLNLCPTYRPKANNISLRTKAIN